MTTLEPPSGFELGIAGLESQRLKHSENALINISFYDLGVFREIFDQHGLKKKFYEELHLLNTYVSIYQEHLNFLDIIENICIF